MRVTIWTGQYDWEEAEYPFAHCGVGEMEPHTGDGWEVEIPLGEPDEPGRAYVSFPVAEWPTIRAAIDAAVAGIEEAE